MDPLLEVCALLEERERYIDKLEADLEKAEKQIEVWHSAHDGLRSDRDEWRAASQMHEAKVERLREALTEILDREEWGLKHAYTTCDVRDSTNADRGCVWCKARAALRGGE